MHALRLLRGPFIGLGISLVVLGLTAVRYSPPKPLGLDAPEQQFSGGRAFALLKKIYREGARHPSGSSLNELVRQRITDEFEKLGYRVESTQTFGCGNFKVCGFVKNIVAAKNSDPGALQPAVLLTAHYDSALVSPGVADDGLGVATLLEVARAIANDPPAKTPIRFLITDGEELGLVGAETFVTQHPWARQPGAVINVDSRGTSGPSMMFETGANNRALIASFGDAVARPVASSAFYETYRRMPNDTDFTVFKRHGFNGLNFANIHDVNFYHTPLDDMEHVSVGTLQHNGDNVLALARAWANGALPAADTRDAVFFDWMALGMVSWPESWTAPWAILALGLFLAAFIVALRRDQTLGRDVAWSIVFGVIALVATALVSAGIWLILRALTLMPSVWPANGWAIVSQMIGWGCFVVLMCAAFFKRNISPSSIWWACWGVWQLLTVVVALAVPTFSYLLIVPGTMACLMLPWMLRRSPLAIQWCGIFPLVVFASLWIPTTWLLNDAIGLMAPPAFALIAAISTLLVLPLFPVGEARALRLPIAGMAALIIFFTCASGVISPLSQAQPGRMSIVFEQSEPEHNARWIAQTLITQFPQNEAPFADFGEEQPTFPWSMPWDRSRSKKTEPISNINGSTLEITPSPIADSATTWLRLRLAPGSEIVQLVLPASVTIRSLWWNENTFPIDRFDEGAYGRVYTLASFPAREVLLTLAQPLRTSIDVTLIDRFPTLPATAQSLLTARGSRYLPSHLGDGTVISQRISLAPER